MDDVKRAAEEYNKIAAVAANAGIQQGLHNEGFEVSSVDGKRTYYILMELLDPKLVKFQFQMSTIRYGFDAAEYFMKYPGRFFSMHLQDWNPETKTIVAVGKGSIDWKKSLRRRRPAGLRTTTLRKHGNDERGRRLSEGSEGLRTYGRLWMLTIGFLSILFPLSRRER